MPDQVSGYWIVEERFRVIRSAALETARAANDDLCSLRKAVQQASLGTEPDAAPVEQQIESVNSRIDIAHDRERTVEHRDLSLASLLGASHPEDTTRRQSNTGVHECAEFAQLLQLSSIQSGALRAFPQPALMIHDTVNDLFPSLESAVFKRTAVSTASNELRPE